VLLGVVGDLDAEQPAGVLVGDPGGLADVAAVDEVRPQAVVSVVDRGAERPRLIGQGRVDRFRRGLGLGVLLGDGASAPIRGGVSAAH
jgi:hypothetical protein